MLGQPNFSILHHPHAHCGQEIYRGVQVRSRNSRTVVWQMGAGEAGTHFEQAYLHRPLLRSGWLERRLSLAEGYDCRGYDVEVPAIQSGYVRVNATSRTQEQILFWVPAEFAVRAIPVVVHSTRLQPVMGIFAISWGRLRHRRLSQATLILRDVRSDPRLPSSC